MLDGRWRRSGLPVLFARHPVETNELYAVAFAALRAAFDRRGLPHPTQIHTDWFPGLPRMTKQVFSAAQHVQGLEHFFRNLSKKTVQDLETGETIKVPKLKKTQILRVVTRHLHKLARSPTLSMFLLVTKTWLDRMEHCWEERDFAAYLKRQYFVERPLNEAIYGWSAGLGASWWYGMTSAVLQGHPASQQQAEASHRQFKRCVGRSPNAQLPDVLKRIKNAVALWAAATSQSESSYVLRTDAGFTGGVPLSPDDWMISRQGTGLWRQHLPGVGAVILPALWRLHEDARKKRARGAARMFIMRTGCPASVDPGMADAMVAQVITKKIPQLQGLLLQHGILTPFEHPIASHRISFEKLTDMWTDRCIVSHVPARVRWQMYVVCFGDPDSFEDLIHALVFHACVLELRRPRQQLLAAVRDCLLQQCALAGIFSEKGIVLMPITFKNAWPFACSPRFRCRQLPMHLPVLRLMAMLPLWRLPGVCESDIRKGGGRSTSDALCCRSWAMKRKRMSCRFQSKLLAA